MNPELVVGNLTFNERRFQLVEDPRSENRNINLLVIKDQHPLIGVYATLTDDYATLYPHPNPRPYTVNETVCGTRFILNPDEKLNELANNNHTSYGWSLNILHQEAPPSPKLLAAFGINISTLHLTGRERFVDDILRKFGRREKPISVEKEQDDESIGVVEITDPSFYKKIRETLAPKSTIFLQRLADHQKK